jgi:hypothetical protein
MPQSTPLACAFRLARGSLDDRTAQNPRSLSEDARRATETKRADVREAVTR